MKLLIFSGGERSASPLRRSSAVALLLGALCGACSSSPELTGKYTGTWQGVVDDTTNVEPCSLDLDLSSDEGAGLQQLTGAVTMNLECLRDASGTLLLADQIEANVSGISDDDGNFNLSPGECDSTPCFKTMFLIGVAGDDTLAGDTGFILDTGLKSLSVDGKFSIKK